MTNNTINNVPRELLDSLLTVIESNGYAAAEVEVVDELRVLLSAPSPANHVEDVRAMVAAPSPAGVDGLEVIGWYTEDHLDDKSATTYSREVADRWLAKGWPITGIANFADAQAIIDGLWGEVADLRSMLATVSKAGLRAREERDAALVECERRQMQLAACGVVALANTIESAGEARQMHPDYMSASCSDVAGAVDREIALRAERDQQAQRIGELEELLLEARLMTFVVNSGQSGVLRGRIDAALSASSAPK